MKKKRGGNRAFYQGLSDKKEGQKTSVLIADDHLIMRKGLNSLINAEDDLFVVAEACNGKEAVILAHEISPDIVVMDYSMPIINGIEATKEIILANPSIRIIGISLNGHDYVRQGMLKAGASLYLSKNDVIDMLCSAIREIVKLPNKEV